MKLYIWKISLFAFILFLILFACELIAEMSPNSYSYKNSYVMQNGSKIETLALGTSHAYAAINPTLFRSRAFNLANSAQPLKFDYAALDRYDKVLTNLKTVILDVAYHSIRMPGFDSPETDYYYIYYNVFMDYSGDGFSFKNNFLLFNMAVYKESLKNIIKRTNLRCDSLGQGNYYDIKDKNVDTNENGLSEVKAHTIAPSKFVGVNVDYLDRIAQFCKSRGVRLVVISTPVWHTYYDNMNSEQYAEMQSVIKDLQERYGVEYYRFMNDKRFVEDDFRDSHHLSNLGAEKFSRILADTLAL